MPDRERLPAKHLRIGTQLAKPAKHLNLIGQDIDDDLRPKYHALEPGDKLAILVSRSDQQRRLAVIHRVKYALDVAGRTEQQRLTPNSGFEVLEVGGQKGVQPLEVFGARDSKHRALESNESAAGKQGSLLNQRVAKTRALDQDDLLDAF